MTGLAGIPANRREGIDRGGQSVIRFQCVERSIAAFTGYKEIDKSVYKWIYTRFVLRGLDRRRD